MSKSKKTTKCLNRYRDAAAKVESLAGRGQPGKEKTASEKYQQM